MGGIGHGDAGAGRGEETILRAPGARIPAAFWSELKAAMERCGPHGAVVVDLGDVTDMDSTTLGFLVTAWRTGGSKLVVAGLRPDVREVFRITQLDTLFTVRE